MMYHQNVKSLIVHHTINYSIITFNQFSYGRVFYLRNNLAK